MNVYIRKKNYTVINNIVMQDKRLSLKARGLLGLCLSLPDDWKYNVRGLAGFAGCSVNAICSGFAELEHAGYVQRNKYRDSNGRIQCDYIIHDEPQETLESAEQVQPEPQNNSGPTEPEQEPQETCIKNEYREKPQPVLKNQYGKKVQEKQNNKTKYKNNIYRERDKYIYNNARYTEPCVSRNKLSLPLLMAEQSEKQEKAFKQFWECYPRHVSKPLARIAFRALPVDDALYSKILNAIEQYRKTPQWQDENFIPYPATFLQDERWEDDIPEPAQEIGGYYDALLDAADKYQAQNERECLPDVQN